MLTLALVPLDERPVNTRYPQMLGAIAGVTVWLPPAGMLGAQRRPADLGDVADWLRDAAPRAAAALVSCDFLGCGNLISARISDDSAADVLARLQMLAAVNAVCPVHAFSLITRVANADNAVEEPEYWADWGTRFYAWARETHQAESEKRESRAGELPDEWRADWLTRRLRNHTVNLGLLDMAARGQLASLLLTSDDTSPFGFPTRERDWLGGWPQLIGPALADKVRMHPGADEVGSALVAKLLTQKTGQTPRVWVEWAVPGGADIIAPYEDRPARETVAGQIDACGGISAESLADADFILGVVPPSPRRTEFQDAFADAERAERESHYRRFLEKLAQTRKPVALADIAYPNGSDPLLISLLLDENGPLAPGALTAYGAWNTAGNTLGTTVAQAVCALHMEDDPARRMAQTVFLAHRFLEDWGYQHVVRRAARADALTRRGVPDPDPNDPADVEASRAFVERSLLDCFARLQTRGVGVGLSLVPGSVRLPWRRLFEADFVLAPA